MGWLSSAGDLIAHRGPDDCGMWIAPDGSAGLVHRRLSIIDLTAAGHQPMVDPETGVVIAYNGEIYNYRELRAELQARGRIFRSVSDTEVLVQGLVRRVSGELVHLDSPDLEHWPNKQNKYTTGLAIEAYNCNELVDKPRLFGTPMQQRMWLKKHFMWLPCRYIALFLYHYLVLGAWRAGWVGYAWSRLRTDVYRLWEYKLREIRLMGRLPVQWPPGPGQPDPRVRQY